MSYNLCFDKTDAECIFKELSIKVPKSLTRKRKTIDDKDFISPKYNEYNFLVNNNYKVKQLKEICRKYKQKVSGNKDELTFRLYNYLRLSNSLVIIQYRDRNFLLKKYNNAHGPACFNRNICVNTTDFLTMDSLQNIPYSQFFSFEDSNKQIYGFDILSLVNLLSKGGLETTNPYNRQKFPISVRENINYILRASKMFGDNVVVKIEQPKPLPIAKQIELRSLALFQDIDDLGNYTDSTWFTSLSRIMLIRYLRELGDIWGYRAQLSESVKREICPPVGDPFRTINLHTLPNISLDGLKKMALTVMEYLVRRGVNESSRALGANYVLCALTLVNNDAANALPWLYHSVSQHLE